MSAECRKIAGSFPQPTYDGPLCSCQGGCALEIETPVNPFQEDNLPDQGGQIPYDADDDMKSDPSADEGAVGTEGWFDAFGPTEAGEPDITEEEAAMRQFETGATRNKEVDPDIYGFTSPLALHAFAAYMHANRLQADGTMRDSDNWKKGIPQDSYIRSMRRHLQDLTLHWDGYPELAREDMFAAACGLFFNVQGFIHEAVKADIEFGREIQEIVLSALAENEGETEETDA